MKIPAGIQIYTDGSCYYKTGEGGIGVYIEHNGSPVVKYSKGFDNFRTGRSELMAGICALKLVNNKFLPTILFSDSQYFVKGANHWLEGWKAKSFVGVKNVDLMKILDEEIAKFPKNGLLIKWVKGHIGVEGNEIADVLAGEGRKSNNHIYDTHKWTSEEIDNFLLNS